MRNCPLEERMEEGEVEKLNNDYLSVAAGEERNNWKPVVVVEVVLVFLVCLTGYPAKMLTGFPVY